MGRGAREMLRRPTAAPSAAEALSRQPRPLGRGRRRRPCSASGGRGTRWARDRWDERSRWERGRSGVADGVDDRGSLVVVTAGGDRVALGAGEVHLRL